MSELTDLMDSDPAFAAWMAYTTHVLERDNEAAATAGAEFMDLTDPVRFLVQLVTCTAQLMAAFGDAGGELYDGFDVLDRDGNPIDPETLTDLNARASVVVMRAIIACGNEGSNPLEFLMAAIDQGEELGGAVMAAAVTFYGSTVRWVADQAKDQTP